MSKAVLLVTVFSPSDIWVPWKVHRKRFVIGQKKKILRSPFSFLVKYNIVNIGNQEKVREDQIVDSF